MACSPPTRRLVPDAHRVKVISFTEAAELAYFGAKVLHPATVMPAIDRNIPVMILNSRRPQVEGTRIQSAGGCQHERCEVHRLQEQSDGAQHPIHAHVHGARLHAADFRDFRSLSRLRWTWWRRPRSASRSRSIRPERLDAIVGELREFAEVSVDENQAIICMVGENIRHTPGVAARVFNALGASMCACCRKALPR